MFVCVCCNTQIPVVSCMYIIERNSFYQLSVRNWASPNCLLCKTCRCMLAYQLMCVLSTVSITCTFIVTCCSTSTHRGVVFDILIVARLALCQLLCDPLCAAKFVLLSSLLFSPGTTRQPKEGERQGIDYNFVSVEEFKRTEKNGELLESGVYESNYYGTSLAESQSHCVRSL